MDEIKYTAFIGPQQIAAGTLPEILPPIKARYNEPNSPLMLIFEDHSGRQVDFELRGTLDDVLARELSPKAKAGPGRPKLGVVSREVSLLPRHWEWLEQQPSGASAALRRIVDQARKNEPNQQRERRAQEAAGRFMTAVAGNLLGFEEATRALYAGNQTGLAEQIRDWPVDIRNYIQKLLTAL